MTAWRSGARGGAEVAGGGCGAHHGRRRARSSPVGMIGSNPVLERGWPDLHGSRS
jgi:hypothetical protein